MKINFKKCAPALIALPVAASIAMAVSEHRKRKQNAKWAAAKLEELVSSVNAKDEEIRRLENKLNAEKWFGDTWKWMLEEEWKGKGVDINKELQRAERLYNEATANEETEED